MEGTTSVVKKITCRVPRKIVPPLRFREDYDLSGTGKRNAMSLTPNKRKMSSAKTKEHSSETKTPIAKKSMFFITVEEDTYIKDMLDDHCKFQSKAQLRTEQYWADAAAELPPYQGH